MGSTQNSSKPGLANKAALASETTVFGRLFSQNLPYGRKRKQNNNYEKLITWPFEVKSGMNRKSLITIYTTTVGSASRNEA